MFDTRTPGLEPRNYWSLSAQLNSLYAQQFRYDFIYYLDDQTDVGQNGLGANEEGPQSIGKTTPACYLNGSVPRGSPWGKLPAVADALSRGYETVVYIDSDAFFRSDAAARSIEALVQQYGSESASSDAENTLNPGDVVLWMPSNAPWGAKSPNSGLQIWRNQPEAKALLCRWWKMDLAALEHPYEQSAIKRLYRKKKCPSSSCSALPGCNRSTGRNYPRCISLANIG